MCSLYVERAKLCLPMRSEGSSNFLRQNTISLWWFKLVSSLFFGLSLLTLINSRNFMKEDSEIHFFIKFSHCSNFLDKSFKELIFRGFYLEIKFPLQIWSLIFSTAITKLNESMPKEILPKQMLPEHQKCKASCQLSFRIHIPCIS